MQPGLGKGVAQVSAGASVAVAGFSGLVFRTAVCYAAEKGMTCGNPLTISVVIGTFLMMSGGWTVKVGLQNIIKGQIGDRTVSAVNAADRFGQLLGHGKIGTQTKKTADDLQQAYQASSDLYNSVSNGAAWVSNWWYGTPEQPAAAPAPATLVKAD
ncbi:MAG: hypothetical protein LLG04_00905 [Parachlamydia sp.]|nr:hypothetical protein [Parachlamydia sp.]